MGEAVKKISTALNAGEGNSDLYSTAISKSFVLSVVSPRLLLYYSQHDSILIFFM